MIFSGEAILIGDVEVLGLDFCLDLDGAKALSASPSLSSKAASFLFKGKFCFVGDSFVDDVPDPNVDCDFGVSSSTCPFLCASGIQRQLKQLEWSFSKVSIRATRSILSADSAFD